MRYQPAGEAAMIAEELIPEYHVHLQTLRVEYLFIDKTPKKGGQMVLARARKVAGLPAYLAAPGPIRRDGGEVEDLFVIEIAYEPWQQLTDSQKRALIDHELCHCVIEEDEETGNVNLGIRGHDLEGFTEEAARHGFWRKDLQTFVEAALEGEQLTIPGLLKKAA